MKAALKPTKKAFIIHISSLNFIKFLQLALKTQIALSIAEKIIILKKLAIELHKYWTLKNILLI